MEKFFNKSRCLYLQSHVHIVFRKSVSDYDCFDKILEFVSEEWEKRKHFFEGYKRIYPRLITSLKWSFDYLRFINKKVKNGSCAG